MCSCRNALNESQARTGSGYPLLNNVEYNEQHTYIACRVGCTTINTHTNLARALWDSKVLSSLRTCCYALPATCIISVVRPKLVTRHGYAANIRFWIRFGYGFTTIPIPLHCAAALRGAPARTSRTPPGPCPAQRSANSLL